MRSAQVELWVHSISIGPIILMFNKRLGEAWFLKCTSVSFWKFFSLTRTGQTPTLKNSWFGGTWMSREVKKEGWTSECNCPLFPLGVVATPLWAKCEDETHTPKSGNLESSGTPKNSELDCRGQNTSHWGVLYINGKVLKCRCPKWPCMSHLDTSSPSNGQKKGGESN
jgi:hypothetical protein